MLQRFNKVRNRLESASETAHILPYIPCSLGNGSDTIQRALDGILKTRRVVYARYESTEQHRTRAPELMQNNPLSLISDIANNRECARLPSRLAFLHFSIGLQNKLVAHAYHVYTATSFRLVTVNIRFFYNGKTI